MAVSPLSGSAIPAGGQGRKKGSRNKVTRQAKDNICAVYEGLGSVKGHIAFLKKHPKELAEFYKNVYTKVLPLDINQDVAGGLEIIFREIVTSERPPE